MAASPKVNAVHRVIRSNTARRRIAPFNRTRGDRTSRGTLSDQGSGGVEFGSEHRMTTVFGRRKSCAAEHGNCLAKGAGQPYRQPANVIPVIGCHRGSVRGVLRPTHEGDLMNLALWIAAGLLAAVALAGGVTKSFLPQEKLAASHGGEWTGERSAGFV